MRQVRKCQGSPGTASKLEARMMVDGAEQWMLLNCPLSPDDISCGEYCAWYAEETVGGALGVPVQVVVSCQGHPIGSLVTE
jgi:hypothetical protein